MFQLYQGLKYRWHVISLPSVLGSYAGQHSGDSQMWALEIHWSGFKSPAPLPAMSCADYLNSLCLDFLIHKMKKANIQLMCMSMAVLIFCRCPFWSGPILVVQYFWLSLLKMGGFPCGSVSKESACNAGDPGSIPRLGRFRGRRAWQPPPVFLPGESPWTEEPGELWGHRKSGMIEQLSTAHDICI